MKKALLFLLLFSTLSLTACTPELPSNQPLTTGETNRPQENLHDSAPVITTLTLADQKKTDYTVVYPADQKGALDGVLTYLQDEFEAFSGAKLRRRSDAAEEKEFEILIGNTNRSESTLSTPLESDEVLVKAVGKKIVIQAGSDVLQLNAVTTFIKQFSAANGLLTVPSSLQIKEKGSIVNLKIATFNILHGKMVNFNFQKLADDIIASGASVVGLQEVDQITSRNQKHDTLKELSEYTGLKYYAYLPTITPFQGGEYGIAVLSKYPIVSTETKLLPKGVSSDEQRGALKAVIDIGGINLDFVVTHCDGNTIAKQLAAIEEMVHRSTFYAVVGDFNCGVYKEFEVFEAATLANNSKNPLITTQNGKYIDNIVCSPGINIHVTTAVNTNHSDHFLVASTITITSE